MEEKNSNHLPLDDDKVLDFEVAKDMTIEEAVKKHKEIEAGVTEDDGLLDRYIKQHREEIESQKFETKVSQGPLLEPGLEEATSVEETKIESLASTPNQETLTALALAKALASQKAENAEVAKEQLDQTIVASPALEPVASPVVEPVTEEALSETVQEIEDDWGQAAEAEKDRKKKILFWSAAGLLLIGILATAFVWLRSVNQPAKETTSSTSSQTSSTASSSVDTNLTAFDQLYNSFFTDSSLTKLKNEAFGKLAELKALLDKLDKNSDSYKLVKEKYDNLEKAIAAVQAINGQFDKEVIVNGEIDQTATAKTEANLTATTTGISSVDSLLASVVNFGRSQQENARAAADTTATTSQPTEPVAEVTAPAETSSPAPAEAASSQVTGSTTGFGLAVPAGVTLQRDRSRVPYNQAAIDDATNEAWTFAPGVLENIVSISQQRGYITGDQYILEKVNIINGNGYYNMFKPDGTYLFSINCKTGYFVGNAAGHADALDY